jgi:hypothetical protein
MVWIYCRRENGPVILVVHAAHHKQTLITPSFDISWSNMVNLLFWDFTYPLIWNQVSQINRTSLKYGLSPHSPWWYRFAKSWFPSRSWSQISCSTVASWGCNTNVSFACFLTFLNANCCSKTLHLFKLWHNLLHFLCHLCSVCVSHNMLWAIISSAYNHYLIWPLVRPTGSD